MNEFIKNLIWRWFGKKILESVGQISTAKDDCAKYADIGEENITALVANSVSNIAMGDAQTYVSASGGGTTRFTDILSDIAEKEWSDISNTVACALGCGAIISVPYSVDNGLGRKIYIDTVTKDRFFVTAKQGDDITQCVILADEFVRDNKSYKRFTDYSIKDGVYIIRNRAVCNNSPVSLKMVEEWADIPEQIAIGGVKQLPIAILKCPQNPRRPKVPSGVPITFGCDATLKKIAKTLNDIEREFEKKKAKVFADRSLIKLHKDKNGDNDEIKTRKEFENNDLYVAFNNSDKIGMEIFDPAIRDSAYYNKLEKHFAMLEKECGLSEGVLTKLSTSHATATEIFRVTNCRCVHSETLEKAAEVSMLLFSQITSSESVEIQLEGYGADGNLVMKSTTVNKLKFLPSVCGKETGADGNSQSMSNEVNQNTAARHTHENKDVLDGLSADGDNLLFNEKNIGGGAEIDLELLPAQIVASLLYKANVTTVFGTPEEISADDTYTNFFYSMSMDSFLVCVPNEDGKIIYMSTDTYEFTEEIGVTKGNLIIFWVNNDMTLSLTTKGGEFLRQLLVDGIESVTSES